MKAAKARPILIEAAALGAYSARAIARGGLRRRWRECLDAASVSGVDSLPIITIATAFAGLVVTHEIAYHMHKALNTVDMIPGTTAQFILRELGIAVPALLLVSKVGAATAAEVGTMKVTEQIDALKLLRIDPVEYLVLPRLVAAIAYGACLTLVAASITLLCAAIAATTGYGFTWLEYLQALRRFVGPADVVTAVIKGTIYSAVVPLVACAYGFRCEGGAEGVGKTTTNTVVTSTILIIVLDFVLTYLFSPWLGTS